MSVWNNMSPVLRGGIAAAILAALGLGYWSLSTDEAMRPEPGGDLAMDSGAALPQAPAPEGNAASQAGALQGAGTEIAAPKTLAPGAEASDADATDILKQSAETDPAATAQAPQSQAAMAADPEARPGAPTAADPTAEEPASADTPKLPEFDLVRVEPDGSAVIAGKAAPGDKILLLLDEDHLAETTADRSGAFVAITRVPPGTTPRVLSLIARNGEGERRSDSSVIVAPLVLAEAAPDAPAPPEGAVGGQASASAAPAGLAAAGGQVDAGTTPDTAPATLATGPEESAPDQLAALAPDVAPVPETEPAPVAQTPARVQSEAMAPAPEPEVVAGDREGPPDAALQAEAVAIAEDAEPVATQTPTAPTAPAEGTVVADAMPEGAVGAPGTDVSIAAPEAAAASVLAGNAEGAPAEAVEAPTRTAQAVPPVASRADTGAAPEVPSGAPQVLVASSKGLRVLQAAEDAKSVPLRVETIGYSQDGVTLAGRGDGGPSNLRIYLDNAPVGEAALAADGSWETELEGVEPGKYTLRVDQIGQNGAVSSRFETPFLRETDEALARSAPVQTDRERVAISVITVQPGYSLWLIATDRYGDGMAYHKVLAANADQIRDPDLIYPGQVFDLPPE